MTPAPRPYKFIVVDDSPVVRDLVKHFLESDGHHVVTLESPLGLTNMMSSERPDMVILDVNMPALDGDKALLVVSKHRRLRCRFILYSDLPTDELAQIAASCGADGYIQKTNDRELFLRSVRRLLSNR